MNYYIDFDSTLYDTSKLTNEMLTAIAWLIHTKNPSIDASEIFDEGKNLFNSQNFYNIFELCSFFADKYNLDEKELAKSVNHIVDDGSKFVFDDSIEFLKRLKTEGHSANLLTFAVKQNTDYQLQKIKGSGLGKYFDSIIITSTPKWLLSIDYKNGIFVDDNPQNIENLYVNNPINVIRVKRKDNKYSSIKIAKGIAIAECYSLLEIELK